MRTELINRMIALMPIASKNPTRFHLSGIAVSCIDTSTILLEVTDGHRMIREEVKDDILPSMLGDDKILITRDALPQLKNCININGIDRDKKLIMLLGSGAISLEILSNYPNLKQLEPNEHELTHKIGFNAQYIIELAKALTESKQVNICLRVKFNEDKQVNAPMIVQVGNRKSVLMPVRV